MTVYEIVTNKIISQLEDALKNGGLAPWQKPWNARKVNYVTGKPYRGINLWLLPDDECEFLTYRQFQKLQAKNPDICIKKGSKMCLVVFWKYPDQDEDNEQKDNNDNDKKSPIIRYYRVFKLKDIDELDSKFKHSDFSPIQSCEELITSIKSLDLRHGGSQAFYSPLDHYVNCPYKESFTNTEEYYSTVFHELTHWTGHTSLLNRHLKGFSRNHDSYSKEELIAEMGSAMLLAICNVDSKSVQTNQVAYIRGWLKKLTDDKSIVISAAQRAQTACDLLISMSSLNDSCIAV